MVDKKNLNHRGHKGTPRKARNAVLICGLSVIGRPNKLFFLLLSGREVFPL
jgi:hypothetical protein